MELVDKVEGMRLEDLEPGGVIPRGVVPVAPPPSTPPPPPPPPRDESSYAAASGATRRPDHTFVEMQQGDSTEAAVAGNDATSTRSLAMDSFTTAASTLSLEDFCKICHCGEQPLIAPCFCCGSLKYVHQDCLQRWIKSANIKRCELCKYPFSMQSKVKPFCQWEKLDMTSLERRKLFCSVTFHLIAITCVAWSLYVLIDRTAAEIRQGQLQWPFWTKLVVVAIGFTGGLVFMYIQCKVYVHLCRKWKAYNRIIVVQDAPEGIHKARKDSSVKSSEGDKDFGGGGGRVASSHPNAVLTDAEATTAAAEPVASCSSPGSGSSCPAATVSSKSNAETQTALRGVSIRELPVVKILEGGGGGGQEGATTIFFTECEIASSVAEDLTGASLVTPSSPPHKEALLICDLLPGQQQQQQLSEPSHDEKVKSDNRE